MKKVEVLVLAGTADARDVVRTLLGRDMGVLVSTVTVHGAEQYVPLGVSCRIGRLDQDRLLALVHRTGVRVLVDATHPFAEEAHCEARAAAERAHIPYVRYERHSLWEERPAFLSSPLVHWVDDERQAAELAPHLGACIFLTTGSKRLSVYTDRLRLFPQRRLVVRLLPTVKNLERCAALGVDQADIVAVQGPFSEALNAAMYEKFDAQVLVTKESGAEGGFAEKVRPALERGAQVIIVRRPRSTGAPGLHSMEDLAQHVVTALTRRT